MEAGGRRTIARLEVLAAGVADGLSLEAGAFVGLLWEEEAQDAWRLLGLVRFWKRAKGDGRGTVFVRVGVVYTRTSFGEEENVPCVTGYRVRGRILCYPVKKEIKGSKSIHRENQETKTYRSWYNDWRTPLQVKQTMAWSPESNAKKPVWLRDLSLCSDIFPLVGLFLPTEYTYERH